MADNKVLQAILDGQVKIREDLKRVEEKVDRNGQRIDKLGFQLANLEDDAPTLEEFDKLDRRVQKIENHFASV